MLKRMLDIILSATALILFSPVLLVAMLLVWWQDGHSPLYVAPRAGRGGIPFQMIKLRSMIVAADNSGVTSTAATDSRITPIGHFVRRWKLDELTQLWNVLLGDMSLVGPRPNTLDEVALYSADQQELLTARPGITDCASIVFSDEGEILRGAADPNLMYQDVIWPWKSALGLLYVRNIGLWLDVKLIALTVVAIANRPIALRLLQKTLYKLGASKILCDVAARDIDLSFFKNNIDPSF
jgi:lipopolysaccharide/colanic/teichoic acid biosynthesis glycosyltransferase